MDNPWGLTPGQIKALQDVCVHGGSKRASLKTGLGVKTYNEHIHTAKKKMGYFGPDIRMFLEFHEWMKNESARRN